MVAKNIATSHTGYCLYCQFCLLSLPDVDKAYSYNSSMKTFRLNQAKYTKDNLKSVASTLPDSPAL